MTSEPTTGEVLRRLDQVAGQLEKVAAELRADRLAAAETYVRKDVYAAEHTSHDRRLQELEQDNDAREKAADQFRRQVLASLIVLAIPALVGLFVSVNVLLSGGTPQ